MAFGNSSKGKNPNILVSWTRITSKDYVTSIKNNFIIQIILSMKKHGDFDIFMCQGKLSSKINLSYVLGEYLKYFRVFFNTNIIPLLRIYM